MQMLQAERDLRRAELDSFLVEAAWLQIVQVELEVTCYRPPLEALIS